MCLKTCGHVLNLVGFEFSRVRRIKGVPPADPQTMVFRRITLQFLVFFFAGRLKRGYLVLLFIRDAIILFMRSVLGVILIISAKIGILVERCHLLKPSLPFPFIKADNEKAHLLSAPKNNPAF